MFSFDLQSGRENIEFLTIFLIELKKFLMTKTLPDSLPYMKPLILKPRMSHFTVSRHPKIVSKA